MIPVPVGIATCRFTHMDIFTCCDHLHDRNPLHKISYPAGLRVLPRSHLFPLAAQATAQANPEYGLVPWPAARTRICAKPMLALAQRDGTRLGPARKN